MQCAECGVRSAVGYCGECETLLCEVCGRTCSQCGKVACRSHLQRTSSGRNICVSCVVLHYDKRARQSKERRERRAEEAALGAKTHKHHKHHNHPRPATAEPENLSFESLARDMAPAPIPVFVPEPDEPERERESRPYEIVRPHDAFDHGPLRDREALNTRVLTGSASTGTPPWISGLGMGLFAWLLCFSATGETVLPLQGGILSLVAFLLSAGAVAWTAPGAFIKEAAPIRVRSRVAFGVGAGALFYSAVLNIVHWL
jgi:hypothetical protein